MFDRVLGRDDLADLDVAQRRLELRRLVVENHASTSHGDDIAALVGELADEIDGHGPISGLMNAPGVTDVLINGPFEIWIERAGKTELTEARFRNEELSTIGSRGCWGGPAHASMRSAPSRTHT